MKILVFILIGLFSLVALFLVVGLFMKKEYHVVREVVANKPKRPGKWF